MGTISPPPDCPLRIGQPEEFRVIRGFLHQAGFDDATLCRELGIGGMNEFGQVRWEELSRKKLDARFEWCANVFARGLKASEATSRALCGDAVFAALNSVGLLQRSQKDAASVFCPVWMYPVDGFVTASDRREDPEGGVFAPPPDVVFPAIYPGTLRFLKLLPEAAGGEALDLCGGSGIGALHLSRSARIAATADITVRSAFFAEFNAQLNGVPMESHCGDLFEPVRGRQFDLITAHPPFVPATGERMVYRDGGDTGEEITRRIIEGIPAHLRPGGTAMVLCVACDTEQPYEQRARQWLGDARDEFDLVFGLEKILSVEDVVESMRKRGQNIGPEQARQLYERLRSFGTSQFVYGALFIRRSAERINATPFRIRLTTAGAASDFNRLFQWREFTRREDFHEALAGTHLRLPRELQLTARHVVRDGELVPAEFVFAVDAGFQAALRPDGWVVPLVARLTGEQTARQVFESAKNRNELPDGFALKDFLGLLQLMVERGLLDMEFPGRQTLR